MGIKEYVTLWTGAIISIVVVFITHQLATSKTRREQDLSLRRDIYLAAIEAASAGMMALGQIATSDVSAVEATRLYREKGPSIMKVYLVAKIDALKTFTKFRDELDIALSRTAMRRDQPGAELPEKKCKLLKEWNQDADYLGRLFTSVLFNIRAELGLKIEEELLHRLFDESRTKRRDMVAEKSNLLCPSPD
jgi:hypothetical protein